MKKQSDTGVEAAILWVVIPIIFVLSVCLGVFLSTEVEPVLERSGEIVGEQVRMFCETSGVC